MRIPGPAWFSSLLNTTSRTSNASQSSINPHRELPLAEHSLAKRQTSRIAWLPPTRNRQIRQKHRFASQPFSTHKTFKKWRPRSALRRNEKRLGAESSTNLTFFVSASLSSTSFACYKEESLTSDPSSKQSYYSCIFPFYLVFWLWETQSTIWRILNCFRFWVKCVWASFGCSRLVGSTRPRLTPKIPHLQ